ncbi:MAG: hypothetical protein QOG49_405 [Frankiaceae bacterium]|nr:hypothetical protein [Frankiaceae bacterium]
MSRATMSGFINRHRAAVGFVSGVAVCAGLAGAGVAIAAIPSPTGSISACAAKSTGRLRVIDVATGAHCATTETSLGWSRGYRYRAAWNARTSYAAGDVVLWRGTSYLAKTASRAKQPVAGTWWGILAAAGARGASGPTGPAGATGPAGPAGTNGTNGVNGTNGINGTNGVNGTAGTAGISGYSQVNSPAVTVAGTAGSIGSATAVCPAGTSVLGGGYFTNPTAGIVATRSEPSSSSPGWFLVVRNDSGASTVIQAYAICAIVSS